MASDMSANSNNNNSNNNNNNSSSNNGNNNNYDKYSAMVSHLYTFTTCSRPKSFGHGGLPYVGFPGLTLTPIPENALLDSMLEEDEPEAPKAELWHQENVVINQWSPSAMTKGSLPNHWIVNGADVVSPIIPEDNLDSSSKDSDTSSNSKSCSATVSSKEAFLPSDEHGLTREQRRSHVCKLLLFALFGFVVVAGIVLWIFSPAFT